MCVDGADWEFLREVDAAHVRQRLALLKNYLASCEFAGYEPLRYTVGMLARQLREYRIKNKFYDCV